MTGWLPIRIELDIAVDITPARDWLLTLLGKHLPGNVWSDRMRALAGDLLDDLGRLRAKVEEYDTDRLALELCLRASWPHAFRNSAYPSQQAQNTLLKSLMVEPAPPYGDLERAIVWLKALDLLINQAVETLTVINRDKIKIISSDLGSRTVVSIYLEVWKLRKFGWN